MKGRELTTKATKDMFVAVFNSIRNHIGSPGKSRRLGSAGNSIIEMEDEIRSRGR